MRIRTVILGALVVAVAFVGATLVIDLLWPAAPAVQPNRPALVAVPPLQSLTGTSTVLAPTVIALSAIRDAPSTMCAWSASPTMPTRCASLPMPTAP
ncbi:MAG TPA: hypothetical protein VL048_10895 [Xanthobacteraceae bacterium]|nr:hypothetical protein [Xanthobacteraceae bacterium]